MDGRSVGRSMPRRVSTDVTRRKDPTKGTRALVRKIGLPVLQPRRAYLDARFPPILSSLCSPARSLARSFRPTFYVRRFMYARDTLAVLASAEYSRVTHVRLASSALLPGVCGHVTTRSWGSTPCAGASASLPA